MEVIWESESQARMEKCGCFVATVHNLSFDILLFRFDEILLLGRVTQLALVIKYLHGLKILHR